jgi:mono/diheme cytochrome c family protein
MQDKSKHMKFNKNIIKDKLEDLKQHPVKILALLYPYILLTGVLIGYAYLNNISNIGRNSVPLTFLDTASNQQKDLPLVQPSVIPKTDVMALSQPSNDLVLKGMTIFNTTCVSCHGTDGKGDGVAAASLNPKPRNFTNPSGWINGSKISEIFKTLSEGVPGSGMVAFDTFSPEEKFALAQYIRKTFVPNPPTDTKEDLTALSETFKLAEGTQNPGQIPISDAMLLVIQDGHTKYEKVIRVLKQIINDFNNNGAEIFNKVTDNKIKALTALSSTDEWKKNEQNFVNLIVNELSDAGFNDNVHKLSSSEWDTFYNYIGKLF